MPPNQQKPGLSEAKVISLIKRFIAQALEERGILEVDRITRKQLGQLKPADTNAASIYSPPVGVTGTVQSIIVTNNTGSVATFRIFLDDDGTTFDESTALFWDEPIPVGRAIVLKVDLPMSFTAGNLAVRSSVSDALTFTVHGEEKEVG